MSPRAAAPSGERRTACAYEGSGPRAAEYDAVIVGGGPAGAAAGRALAGAGRRVLLLDRARFPREKPCGGGISTRALTRFPWLRAPLARIPTRFVHKVCVESPDGSRLVEERREPLYLMIRRREFDALLLELARERGLSVREGARVTRLTLRDGAAELKLDSGETLSARLVIGADGVNSVIAKDAGLNPGWRPDQVAVDMMEETPCERLAAADPDAMHVYYGLRYLHGYGYVFPKAAHVNLGMGVLVESFARRDGTPYAGHARFVAELARGGVVRGQSCRENFSGYRIPVGGALPRTTAERVLLCGDAAGFVNAFTGEGIYFAMASGEHAAAAALAALESGDLSARALAGYQRAWSAEFGPELEQSVTVQRILFEDGRRIDTVVRLAAQNAELRRLLTDYATGRVDFRRVKRSLLRHFLPFYLKHKLRKWLGL